MSSPTTEPSQNSNAIGGCSMKRSSSTGSTAAAIGSAVRSSGAWTSVPMIPPVLTRTPDQQDSTTSRACHHLMWWIRAHHVVVSRRYRSNPTTVTPPSSVVSGRGAQSENRTRDLRITNEILTLRRLPCRSSELGFCELVVPSSPADSSSTKQISWLDSWLSAHSHEACGAALRRCLGRSQAPYGSIEP